MVLIGFSGVEEPRPSYFWNAWSACSPDRWKMDADNELQKIDKMTRCQLFEYVTDLLSSSIPLQNMRKQYEDIIDKTCQDGRSADSVFWDRIDSINDKIYDRLNDENLIDIDRIYDNDDIKSIEAVMDENIATRDPRTARSADPAVLVGPPF